MIPSLIHILWVLGVVVTWPVWSYIIIRRIRLESTTPLDAWDGTWAFLFATVCALLWPVIGAVVLTALVVAPFYRWCATHDLAAAKASLRRGLSQALTMLMVWRLLFRAMGGLRGMLPRRRPQVFTPPEPASRLTAEAMRRYIHARVIDHNETIAQALIELDTNWTPPPSYRQRLIDHITFVRQLLQLEEQESMACRGEAGTVPDPPESLVAKTLALSMREIWMRNQAHRLADSLGWEYWGLARIIGF